AANGPAISNPTSVSLEPLFAPLTAGIPSTPVKGIVSLTPTSPVRPRKPATFSLVTTSRRIGIDWNNDGRIDQVVATRPGRRHLRSESVEASDNPVAINTSGSYSRVNKSFGSTHLEELAARVQQLVKPEIPTTLMEKMKRLPDLMKMASFPPKVVRSGICQQVIYEGEKADLNRLPLIQCWPLDGDLSSGQAMDEEAAARVCERGT